MLRKAWVAGALLVSVSAYAAVTVTVNGSNYSIPQTNERGWGTSVTTWIQAISANTLQPSGGTFTLTADVDFGANYGLRSAYFKSRSSNIAGSGVLRLANAESIGWRNAANSGNLLLTVNASDQLTFNGTVLASSSGASFQDSTLSLFDNSDNTKLLAFELSGITTGTTRTLTVPDANTTIVGTDATQTLTNKTISGASNTITNVSLTSGVTGTLPIANGGTNSSNVLNNGRVMVSNAGAIVEGSAITGNRALVSSVSGLPIHSSVTDTELGYVSGVTSSLCGINQACTVTNKTIQADDGLVGAPTLSFDADTDTGIYRVGDNDMGLSVGGNLGLQVKKSAGAFGNVGMGSAPSGSDNYPLLISRTNSSSGTVAQIANPSTSANAKGAVELSTDAGANTGELSVYTAGSTVDAYVDALVLRSTGSTSKLSLVSGAASSYVTTYAGGVNSGNEVMRFNPDYSVQLMQSVSAPASPSAGLKVFNESNVLKTKDSSGNERVLSSTLTADVPAAKGDILVHTGSKLTKLAVGTNGLYLKANSSATEGVEWASAAANLAVSAKTGNYPLTGSDDVVTGDASGGTFAFTLPTAVSNSGKTFYLIKIDSSSTAITISTTSSQTINGIAASNYVLRRQWDALVVRSDGANWLVINQDVRSQDTVPQRIEWLRVTNSGTPTISAQSGSWVSSLSDGGTGVTTVNIATGVFSAAPTCIANGPTGNRTYVVTGTTSTSASIETYSNSSSSLVDINFNIICMGAR